MTLSKIEYNSHMQSQEGFRMKRCGTFELKTMNRRFSLKVDFMEDTHVALTILNYLPVTHTIPSPDKKSDDPSTLKKKIPTKISHEKRKVNFIEGSGKSSSHSLNENLFCN